MINVSEVFKIKDNFILMTDDKHSLKPGTILTDSMGNQFSVISVAFQTNDLYVKKIGTNNPTPNTKYSIN